KDGACPGLNLLQSHAGIDGLPARPGGALQVGQEVDFSLLEFPRGGTKDIDDRIKGGGQIGIAMGKAQRLDFVDDFSSVVAGLGDDATGRRRHEKHAEAVATGRIIDQPDGLLTCPIEACAVSYLEGHAEGAVDHKNLVSSGTAGSGANKSIGE